MRTEMANEDKCIFGHPGSSVLFPYTDGSRGLGIFVCNNCNSVLLSTYGVNPESTLGLILESLTAYYSIQGSRESELFGISEDGKGDYTSMFGHIKRLRRMVREGRSNLGEEKTVSLMKKLFELEEALNA